MGTAHVLDAARRASGLRAVVVVTSDKCYENREWWWPYREDEAMGGHDPYSSSKGCAELVTAAWRRSFFLADGAATVGLGSARAGNVIGGGDWAEDRLVPDCMRAFASGEPVVIRRPAAVRPWQHVLEPLSGYLTLAERLSSDPGGFGEAWNFGPSADEARPVAWVVDRLSRFWGDGARLGARFRHASARSGTLAGRCLEGPRPSRLDTTPVPRRGPALDRRLVPALRRR